MVPLSYLTVKIFWISGMRRPWSPRVSNRRGVVHLGLILTCQLTFSALNITVHHSQQRYLMHFRKTNASTRGLVRPPLDQVVRHAPQNMLYQLRRLAAHLC